MANREESNAAEHETFPGPGPLRADEAKRGIRPVEQMVDAAIDRIAREHETGRAKDSGQRDSGHRDSGVVDANWAPAERSDDKTERNKTERSKTERGLVDPRSVSPGSVSPGSALALTQTDGPATLAMGGSARRAKARLRWKGLDVSEEFRSYADRVARGEDLPPFQGKILAEADTAFPWDPAERDHTQRRALKQQLGLWTGVALFLGLSIWVLVVQVGKQSDPAHPLEESPLASVVLSNQPVQAAPPLEDTPAVEAAGLEQPGEPSPTADPGTTAVASLQERPPPAARTAPVSTTPARVAAPAPSTASAAPAPASSSAGVLLATRPAASDRAASKVTASAAPPALAGSNSAARVETPQPLASGVTTAVAAATPAAAAAASPIEPAPSATNTDPKKEPGREASTMGPLLVEKPSF